MESEVVKRMLRGFVFSRSKFILALVLMAVGAASIILLSGSELDIAGKNSLIYTTKGSDAELSGFVASENLPSVLTGLLKP